MLLFTGAAFHWFYFSLVLLFTGATFSLVLLFTGAIFHWFYFSLVPLFTGSTLHWCYFLQVLLSTGAAFHWCCFILLLLYRYSLFHTWFQINSITGKTLLCHNLSFSWNLLYHLMLVIILKVENFFNWIYKGLCKCLCTQFGQLSLNLQQWNGQSLMENTETTLDP